MMSELHGGSETAEPAGATGTAARPEAGSGRESGSHRDAAQDDGFRSHGEADVDALLSAEERQPESRTRLDAAAGTWGDDTDDPAGSDPATEHDGDVEALLAGEEQLADSRTRQEAAAATWDDATSAGDDDPGAFSGDRASEYDGDVAALLATEQRLPESRTRQEAAADAWGEAGSGQDGGGDAGTGSASSSQVGTVSESPPPSGEVEGGRPDPDERQVTVRARDGTAVPITVEYVPPEARTVGDTTPTGIGRKPTGEELFGGEGDDPAKGRLDRLLEEVADDAADARDAASNVAETVHYLRLPGPGPGSGHAHEAHPVHEPVPPAAPAFSDFAGSAVLVGVALLTGIRYGVRRLGKGDER